MHSFEPTENYKKLPNLNFCEGKLADRESGRFSGGGADLDEELAQGRDLLLADALPVDLGTLGLASLQT